MSNVAIQAIEQSEQQNETVTIERPNGGWELAEILDTLSAHSDDNTDYPGPDEDGTYIYEYWTASWRVHVVGPRRS